MKRIEYLEMRYEGLPWIDLSENRKMIEEALWSSYDNGVITDTNKFRFASNLCKSLYNKLKDYEDLIIDDLEELNCEHGTPSIPDDDYYEISSVVQDMAFICETYHKYFEFIDKSIVDETPQKEIKTEEKDKDSNSTIKTKLVSDQSPEHRNWYVKVLNSKISNKLYDRDTTLFNNLYLLFDELCNYEYLNDNGEDREVFIYRFSGLNGPFPPERKISWNGKNTFLGYIVRCLISDEKYEPMGLSTVASFFQSKSGNSMNLATAKNYIIKDFEKEKDYLDRSLVNAIELLKKCGFIHVEFTSSRRS